eukprot:gnl/MRDRNA2_/MRDRNA2_116195_c0_seq1.p1 gnl/MRDRNA2_/MRDRNA2_116195_c0~~gnl/MRDRNA2_/MRDRNA2_116195_c0_seq1.p1  ORF type:complete len:370 (+),score=86.71 gnl/MRDRNA2_/MRDRNA2_116195_c0_seq1:70-1110(+)
MAYILYQALEEALRRLPRGRALATLEVIEKLVGNTMNAPDEEKFRKVRLTNAKLAESITNVPGAIDAMLAMGWQREGEENLILPMDKKLVYDKDMICILKTKEWFKDMERKANMLHSVQTDQFSVADPRGPGKIGIVAFYYPGHPCPWDSLCSAGFLGNFWDVGCEGLRFAVPGRDPVTFTNSESAFQACKFWDHAAKFARLSGDDAFKLKVALRGTEDFTYGGFGNNWLAMQAVLAAKFKPGSELAHALLQTADTFLLEHNVKEGRDKVWSDNKIGDGTNWLGAQLMILRDELRSIEKPDAEKPWSRYVGSLLDMQSGEPSSEEARKAWQVTVAAAAQKVLERCP